MFSIYSQGWAADARKQSSIEVTKIKAFKKKQPCIFVCLFFGWVFLFNFYFHVLQQNNVYKMELMEKQHCVECLAPLFLPPPRAPGLMQRQTLAQCLWKHRHDEAIFGPSRCSQIRPRSTKQIPSSFPTIQENMDGFQKYGSKYIFEVIFLDHL